MAQPEWLVSVAYLRRWSLVLVPTCASTLSELH